MEVAQKIGNGQEEIRALAYEVQLLSKRGLIEEAEKYFPRMYELAESSHIDPVVYFSFIHAIALYQMAQNDIDSAQRTWEEDYVERPSVHSRLIALRWIATCMYKKGSLEDAQKVFQQSLQEATQNGLHRSIIFSLVKLAIIDLDNGFIDTAMKKLEESDSLARKYQDREHLVEIEYVYARLYTMSGDIAKAHAAITEAIDLFERLGMRRELAEAREELARLEAQMAASAE
jgi:tetratricopeptide (TPR) repeat protein